MKIYFIAGETSGDFIGSKIIHALKQKSEDESIHIEYVGIGGPMMQKEGVESLFSIDEISVMGFWEVIPSIFRIKKLIADTVEDIILHKPDIVVTIDSPGFTFRVAKQVAKALADVKLVHIVAPSVWAYKPGRAKKYAELYHHLFTLLPFEAKFFEKHGLRCTYIGHPILEQHFYSYSQGLRDDLNLPVNHKVISVTPGSRKGEIKRHMPIIRKTLDRISETRDINALFIQSDDSKVGLIAKYLQGAKFAYSFSTDRLKAFAASNVALSKSGTNNLEIAASKVPQIVGYQLHPITFWALKLMIKIRFACLINIIPNREIIPEFIGPEYNEDNLVLALSDLLNDKKKATIQVNESIKILERIGFNSEMHPSEVAADKLFDIYNAR